MINGAGFFSLLFLLIPLNFLISKKILQKRKVFFNVILLLNLFFTVYCLLLIFYLFGLVIEERDYNIVHDFYLNYDLILILISGGVQVLMMHVIFKIFFKDEYLKNFITFLMLYSAPVILMILIKIYIDYV
jgi:hypothetical protein